MPLTKDGQRLEIPPVSSGPYRRLLRSFGVRLCVAVTLAVILMGAVELYSYYRYRDYGRDVLEPGVKLDMAENGNAEDREYWNEYAQSGRRPPYRAHTMR
ncbi:MAG: hypothetical protein ABR874_10200 [Candidatus Sulfotelmatobacter sp.]